MKTNNKNDISKGEIEATKNNLKEFTENFLKLSVKSFDIKGSLIKGEKDEKHILVYLNNSENGVAYSDIENNVMKFLNLNAYNAYVGDPDEAFSFRIGIDEYNEVKLKNAPKLIKLKFSDIKDFNEKYLSLKNKEKDLHKSLIKGVATGFCSSLNHNGGNTLIDVGYTLAKYIDIDTITNLNRVNKTIYSEGRKSLRKKIAEIKKEHAGFADAYLKEPKILGISL
ncbi:MAG: hypothetical protein ACK4OM_05805 [Alphaproteobacteria bacterium]